MKKAKAGRPVKGSAKTVSISVTMDPKLLRMINKTVKRGGRSEWICGVIISRLMMGKLEESTK